MLTDKLREGAQGRIFKIIFWIIILSFIFTGVGGYLIPRLNTDPVTVGNYSITANEWTNQYQQRAQNIQRMYGAQGVTMLENPEVVKELRMSTLEDMIDNVAFNSAVYDANIRIGDAQVRDEIRKNPVFQKDSKFDNDLYLATVRNMGLSPEYFGEQLRVQLMGTTLSAPLISLASTVLPYELDYLTKIFSQKRVVDLYSYNVAAIENTVDVQDSELQAYYNDHKDSFMTKKSVKFNYIYLSQNDIAKDIKPTDKDLEDYYNMHQDEFAVGETREGLHILVRANSADASDRVAKIKDAIANGEDFASIAKNYSDSQDISLGVVSQNDLSSDLSNALFGLQKVGGISPAIITADGSTHFVSLTAINAPHTQSFADAKSKINELYVAEKSRELYTQKVNDLSDLSFENPDSLDVSASKLNVEVKDSNLVVLGDSTVAYPLNNEEVQRAAFNQDNIESGINSPLITINETEAMVINVYEYHEPVLKTYDEVKADVQKVVKIAKAQEKANVVLNDFAKALSSDKNATVPEHVIARKDISIMRGDASLDAPFGIEVFAIPQDGDFNYTIAVNNNEPTLAVLKKVELDTAENQATIKNLVSQQMALYSEQSHIKALNRQARELTEVEYNQEAIDLVNKTDDSQSQ